jgi:hypothetical protein
MNSTTLAAVGASAGESARAAFVLEPPRHTHWPPVFLATGKYVIGSADDCQILLRVDGILPHHALLIVGAHKTLLRAWDERTWVNDWPVKETVVRPGDRMTFGPITCLWRIARTDEVLANLLPPMTTPPLQEGRLEAEASTRSPDDVALSQLPMPRGDCSTPQIPSETSSRRIDKGASKKRTAPLESRLERLSSRERNPHEPDELSLRRDRDAEQREQSLRDWEFGTTGGQADDRPTPP